MAQKCRKLIALLLMVALVVTYTFGANLSVYAEEGEGDSNAKPAATESANPSPAPAPAPAPAPEPEPAAQDTPDEPTTPDTPAPSDDPESGGDNPSSGGGEVVNPSDSDETDPTEPTEPEVIEDEGLFEEEGPIVNRDGSVTLEYGQSYDLPETPGYTNRYSVQSGSGGYSLSGHTVKNTNDTSGDLTVVIRHRWGYYIGVFITAGYEDITITLKPDKVSVSFKVKEPNEETFSDYGDYSIYKGEDVTPPDVEDPKTVGGVDYNFNGWYTDEDCSEKATAADFQGVASAKTFYGMYSTQATLTYHKNSDGDAATVPASVTAGVGTKVKVGTASRDGYSFSGWNTKEDGSGESYQPGDKVTMVAGGVDLYAQWSDTKITIYYWQNYGNESEAWRSKEADVNSRTDLITETPPRSNFGIFIYVFRGWATSDGASNPTYYPGQTIETEESNINLYAVWSILSLNQLTTLTVKDKEKVYDGKEEKITRDDIQGGTPYSQDPNYIKVGDTAILGVDIYAYVGNIKVSGTNVGQYSTPLSAPLYYYVPLIGLVRLTDNPYMKLDPGILTITKAQITINTYGGEKEYDGEALTAGGYVELPDGSTAEFTEDGDVVTLLTGDNGAETLNVKATGSQTEVGSSDNGYVVDWGLPDGWGTEEATAKKYNYEVVKGEIGVLKVTPKTATLIYHLNGGTYNGSTEDVEVTAEVGETIQILDAPKKEGYKFLYWEGSKHYPGDDYVVEEGGHEFTAVWAKAGTGGDDSDSSGTDTADTFGLIGIAAMLVTAILGLLALAVFRRREE